MKRFISILLALTLLLSATACGADTVSLDVGSKNSAKKDSDIGNDIADKDGLNEETNNYKDLENSSVKDDGVFKIGVMTNTTGEIYALGDFGEDAVIRYDSEALVINALKNGEVDTVVLDNEPAKAFVAANEGLKLLETEYAIEEYAICFPKDSEIKDEVDVALKKLIADGSVKKIVDKYINFDGTKNALVGVPIGNVTTTEKNLIVATNAAYPPYEYIDGDKYYGIDIEIAKLIADKLGYNLVIINMEFDSIVLSVHAGKYDMGIAGLTITDERLEFVDFSKPYTTNIQSVIVPENSAIKTIDDLEPYYQY